MIITEVTDTIKPSQVLRYEHLKTNDTFMFPNYGDKYVRIKTSNGHIAFRHPMSHAVVSSYDGHPFMNDHVVLIDVELRWSERGSA